VVKSKHVLKYAEWLALEVLEVDEQPDCQDFLSWENHIRCLEERMVLNFILL
jgi:hypothetical protein